MSKFYRNMTSNIYFKKCFNFFQQLNRLRDFCSTQILFSFLFQALSLLLILTHWSSRLSRRARILRKSGSFTCLSCHSKTWVMQHLKQGKQGGCINYMHQGASCVFHIISAQWNLCPNPKCQKMPHKMGLITLIYLCIPCKCMKCHCHFKFISIFTFSRLSVDSQSPLSLLAVDSQLTLSRLSVDSLFDMK